MNREIKMNVSLLSTTGDKRVIYVVFTDGDKSAEFAIPEVTLVRNDGFTEEEIEQLTDYAKNSLDEIYNIAKGINPIKSFMKEKI
ncbi:MAG: hypothetical protein IK152_07740 [Lachnospiraceae bacterium]|nr:hypothetical protein [Lachnospiraceae bacterium]MBR5337861.1 hypothetical protein [Lachnospiraceae bacterium]